MGAGEQQTCSLLPTECDLVCPKNGREGYANNARIHCTSTLSHQANHLQTCVTHTKIPKLVESICFHCCVGRQVVLLLVLGVSSQDCSAGSWAELEGLENLLPMSGPQLGPSVPLYCPFLVDQMASFHGAQGSKRVSLNVL